MDHEYKTEQVKKIVAKLRRRWWWYRLAAVAGLLIGIPLLTGGMFTIQWGIGITIGSIGLAHLLTEIKMVMNYQPNMGLTEILREIFINRRYMEEFSPRWRSEVDKIELEISEGRLLEEKKFLEQLQQQRLAEQRRIEQAEQDRRNKQRLLQRADALGLSANFREEVMQLLNQDELDEARVLIEQGKLLRELIDRLKATEDDAFIQRGLHILSIEGVEALEAALTRWHRKAELNERAVALHAEIDDAVWLERVNVACDADEFDTVQRLIAEAEKWGQRLRELQAYKLRIEALPQYLVRRHAELCGQYTALLNTAREMTQREYKKARYALLNNLKEAEEAAQR